MAIDVNSCGMVAAPLNFAGKQHLDPKESVQSVLELENLRPILPPYSVVIVEDDGSLWQMQPNEEDGWVELDVHGGSAVLDDTVISDESAYSSSKVDSTYAKIDNVYDKTTSDSMFGTLTQQESNTSQLQLLENKVSSIGNAVQFKGSCSTKGELLLMEDMAIGHMYIVMSDESMVDYNPFPSTSYIYDGTEWVFIGIQEIKMRDFTLQPINLGSTDENGVYHTEVAGTLSLSNIDLTGIDSKDVSYNNGTFTNVKQALDHLLYVPLTMSFVTNVSTSLEKGNTVVNPTFTWSYSKDIVQQNIDGEVLDNDVRTYTYNGNITTNKTVTLTANDGKSDFKKSVSFSFYNAIYSTSTVFTDVFDSEFVTGFKNKKLSNNCKGDYTLNCADEEYVYFAIPSSMTGYSFWSGGFQGGFELVADNINIENIYGSTCDYDVYRSVNHSLGQTTITIK
jgi:hypothetical protein